VGGQGAEGCGSRLSLGKQTNFHAMRACVIYLMVIYAKAVRGNIPAHLLKAIKEAVQHG
jgi:hypothetical protein